MSVDLWRLSSDASMAKSTDIVNAGSLEHSERHSNFWHPRYNRYLARRLVLLFLVPIMSLTDYGKTYDLGLV